VRCVDVIGGPDDPSGGVCEAPFDDLDGLVDDALRAALHDRIDGQIALGFYPGFARQLMFSFPDARAGRVECIYTGRTIAAENPDAPPVGDDATLPAIDTTPQTDCRYADGTVAPEDCYFNTEHSWLQSMGAGEEPARSDLHHLFPSEWRSNNKRDNNPFGDTTCEDTACPWSENGSELGAGAGGTTVFEVRPKFRGDIARAQFYFAVRYERPIEDTVEATLRAWHAQDPPDDFERERNIRIRIWQDNRNPFVDRPDFVNVIEDL
jgi:hypothetical protein